MRTTAPILSSAVTIGMVVTKLCSLALPERPSGDWARALRATASLANVTLQTGDSINIPEYQPSVKVSGAVNSPGSVLWRRGANLDYYLSAGVDSLSAPTRAR